MINTVLGCPGRLLCHVELPRTLQGAPCTLPSAWFLGQPGLGSHGGGLLQPRDAQQVPGAWTSLWQPWDREERKMLSIGLSPPCWDRNPPRCTGGQSWRRQKPPELCCFSPKTTPHPGSSIASANTEMGIFREHNFRMIHCQNEGMKRIPVECSSFLSLLAEAVFSGTGTRGEMVRPQTGTIPHCTDSHSRVLVIIS